MVSAIVLAAGSSRRMGNVNKLLLPYRNKTIITHVVENILAAGIMDLIVVAGFEASNLKKNLKDLPVQFVINEDHTDGLTSSIQQGIRKANGNGYMICLADMIFIEPGEYFLLLKSYEEQLAVDPKCICQPVYNNQKGNPLIFSSLYRQDILNHKEPEGCKAIVQSNKQHVYTTAMNTNHILKDIDYPEDYEILGY